MIEGWMHGTDLNWLKRQAYKMGIIAEIGSYKGKSTKALLEGCPGIIIAIDHFKGSANSASGSFSNSGDIFQEFIKNVGMHLNLSTLLMDSLSASKIFSDNSIDMIFLDGDHSREGLKADIKAWLPKCKKLICGHDYKGSFAAEHVQKLIKSEGGTTVKFAVEELLGEVAITESGEIWYKEIV